MNMNMNMNMNKNDTKRVVIILPHQMKAVRSGLQMLFDDTIEFEEGVGWFYHSDVGGDKMMSISTFQNILEYLMQEDEIWIDEAMLEDAWIPYGNGEWDFGVWAGRGKNWGNEQ